MYNLENIFDIMINLYPDNNMYKLIYKKDKPIPYLFDNISLNKALDENNLKINSSYDYILSYIFLDYIDYKPEKNKQNIKKEDSGFLAEFYFKLYLNMGFAKDIIYLKNAMNKYSNINKENMANIIEHALKYKICFYELEYIFSEVSYLLPEHKKKIVSLS